MICMYVAATVPVEEGKENALLQQAQEIGDSGEEGSESKVQREPEQGSFENFQAAFSGRRGGLTPPKS